MGNCLVLGLGDADELITVITSNGVVMEFSRVITAGSITDEFPGQAVFRSDDVYREQVFHHEQLLPGKTYYLFPLNVDGSAPGKSTEEVLGRGHHHVRSNSMPGSLDVPCRMTCDCQPTLKRSHTDGFSRYSNQHQHGVWKVKLLITKEQLLEILSQEAPTRELIESVRTVAKFGNGVSPTFAVRMLPHKNAGFSSNI